MGQTKRDNGLLLQPSDVNSSQEHQLNPGALFPRVLEAPSVTLTPSPGAIRVSGGLRHYHGDADRQTLEERRRPCLLALWNVKHKDGKGVQIRTGVRNDMPPSLQKRSDFVDFFALNDGTNDERLPCINLWTSREDTEEFHRQHHEMHRIAGAS